MAIVQQGTEKGLSAQLVLSNLGLFGFGDPEEGLWQTCIELVHNALDSLKCSGGSSPPPPSPSLKITFCVDREDAQCMQVCVYDAGTGISSLTNSLQCFYSTKAQPGAPLSVGRFGVGLTACLLNSHAKTGRDMTIVTKTASSRAAASARYGFDPATKGPVLRQYEEHDLFGFPQGTRIQLDLPRLPADSLVRVVQRVDLFLSRLNSLPSTSVSTVFTVSIEGIITEGNAQAKKSHCSGEGYAKALKGSMQVLPPNEVWAATSLSACPGDESLTVCASAVLCTTTALGVNGEKGEWDGTLQLDVWRCFNGSPLLRFSRDFEACAVTAALQSLKWGNFGLKVKKADLAAAAEGCVEMSLGWFLQSTSRDLPKKLRRCPRQLVVVIDTRGSSLPYSNLRKTALLETPVLTRLVQGAVTAAMHKLQELPDLDESLFLSSKEEKRLEIWSSTIPRVATALTKMLRLSPNLHEYFQAKLDLPDNVASYAACSEFLQEVLTEAYPRNVATTDADADEDEDEDNEGREQQEAAAADEEQDSELL